MHALRAPSLLALTILLPATASAGWVPFAAGEFEVGSPLAASAADACLSRAWGTESVQDGVDSNCFDVPREHRGRKFYVVLRWEGALLGHNLCFFNKDWSYSSCVQTTQGTIPSWAEHASMSATGGTNIRWTLYAYA